MGQSARLRALSLGLAWVAQSGALTWMPEQVTRVPSRVTSAMRPPMGWNSWNAIQCSLTDKVIRETADKLISTGLASLGYVYVNIDDCWQNKTRDAAGRLQPTQWGFPNGMKPVGDYLHSRGLKFGIYADAGEQTCGFRPGSEGHESVDANTFASWGVDFLKYDNCYAKGPLKERYATMGRALRATRRRILYSMCEWGISDPALWAPSTAGAHMWRTSGDLNNTWEGSMTAAWMNNKWAQYARPSAWNDPDMLQIGNGGMTVSEERVQFSLWAIMKAPLIIGCDMRTISRTTLAILSNRKLIAVNQDPLGKQAKLISQNPTSEVWAGPLSGSRQVVALVNKAKRRLPISVNVHTALGLAWAMRPHLRVDAWKNTYSVAYSPKLLVIVPPRDVAVYILFPGARPRRL